MIPRASSAARSSVQFHEAMENLVIGQVVRPAVGVENRRVQVVVNLFQDRDKTLLVDRPFLVGQGFAGTELGQDVVHACQGDGRVVGLLTLAVGVELFG